MRSESGLQIRTPGGVRAPVGATRRVAPTSLWVLTRSSSLTPVDSITRDFRRLVVPLSNGPAGSADPATPPETIQLCPPGVVETETRGPFLMDAAARGEVIAAFAASGRDMVIDYEHQSLTGEEAPAAGWITALEDRGDGEGDGLWAAVSWTPRGATYLQNREYRYLSPVILIRVADRRGVALHSVALTNTPEIRRLAPMVAKALQRYGRPFDSAQDRPAESPLRNTRNPELETPKKEEGPMREQLLTILKLAADATDEAIVQALQALAGRPALAPEITEALGLEAGAPPSEAVASIHALKQGERKAGTVEALQQEVSRLTKDLAQRQRDELVALALGAGKITPAQREWAEAYALRDPEGFKLFTAKSPVVSPVAVVLGGAPPRPDWAIDESQRTVNRLLGVTEEAFKRHAAAA